MRVLFAHGLESGPNGYKVRELRAPPASALHACTSHQPPTPSVCVVCAWTRPGMRLDHLDFGGRAVAGYSVGCPTNTEAECGSLWAYQGRGALAQPRAQPS